MLSLPLRLYSDQDQSQLAQINRLPHQDDEKYVEVCPKRQFVRLMFAGYLIYLVATLFEQLSFPLLALNVLTCVAITSTYCMMVSSESKYQLPMWAWVHSLNSFMLFANVIHCAVFWSSGAHNQPQLRLVNVPALAVLHNMLLTDWSLLPAHSILFTLACTIYRLCLLTEFALVDIAKILALAVVQHLGQLLLCKVQQKLHSRNVVRKKPVPLEEYVMGFKQKKKK